MQSGFLRKISSVGIPSAYGRKMDFSDVSESSPKQLRAMGRVGRPPLGNHARQLIAIRVDPEVLDKFKKEARDRRVGYQTLINEVWARHARKGAA